MPPFKSPKQIRDEMLAQYPLTPADEDLIEEEVRQKMKLPPRKRAALQGVADMEARITQLRADKKKCLDALDEATGARESSLLRDLARTNRDLAHAEQLLRDYHHNHRNRN